jgi:predicted MFS family arabinose efflux permease
LSRKTLLVAGLLLLVVGFSIVGVAPTYPFFIFGVMVAGAGAGLYPTTARALLSDLFVERRGTAFGLHTASGDFGGIIAAGLATLVLAIATWRAGFLPLMVTALLVAAGFHVWSRESYVIATPKLGVRSTLRRLFGQPANRWLLLAYMLFGFTWQASTGFLPTYLQVGKDFTPLIANSAFAVLFGVGVVVKPLAGWLGDRFRRDHLAIVGLGLAAVSLVGIILGDSPLLVTLSVVTFSAGLLSYPPVMLAFVMDLFPDSSYGGDLGAMRSLFLGFGSLGPTYVGFVAQKTTFDVAFAGLIGALLAAGLLIGVVGKAVE